MSVKTREELAREHAMENLCDPSHADCSWHCFVAGHASRDEEIAKKNKEIDRLTRVLAKEVSENDDLGSEYSYVLALKQELTAKNARIERLEKALREIICMDGVMGCETVDEARQALSERADVQAAGDGE